MKTLEIIQVKQGWEQKEYYNEKTQAVLSKVHHLLVYPACANEDYEEILDNGDYDLVPTMSVLTKENRLEHIQEWFDFAQCLREHDLAARALMIEEEDALGLVYVDVTNDFYEKVAGIDFTDLKLSDVEILNELANILNNR